MFFANLNVFFPCSLFLTFTAVSITGGAGVTAVIIVCALVNLTLVVLWLIAGLAPEDRHPQREGRYKGSQVGLTISNVLVLITVGGPLLLAEILDDRRYADYMWFALPVAPIWMILWPLCLFGVWSSRADPFMDKQ